MRKSVVYVLTLFLIGFLGGQEQYYSKDDIRRDWADYSSYQRDELITFCNFLFEKNHYDRALLNYFQFLYRFPGDELESTIYYQIGRCYEKTHNPKLAIVYYQRVLDYGDSASIVFKAANYHKMYLHLIEDENRIVLDRTHLTDDPYLLVFRGYAFIRELDWKSAQLTFLSAEERFGQEYYSNLLNPLFEYIESVPDIPQKDERTSLLASIFPGGGEGYLRKWSSGIGVLSSMIILTGFLPSSSSPNSNLLSFKNSVLDYIPTNSSSNSKIIPQRIRIKSNDLKVLIPSVVLCGGIYFGSSWKTAQNTKKYNQVMMNEYSRSIIKEIPVSTFLDFDEPKIMIK